MKQRILLIFMWVMFPLCLTAQGNFPLVQIQISDLLQYQAQKIKRTIPSSFFSKYTRVRDKKRLEKVGNLVKNSYLYR